MVASLQCQIVSLQGVINTLRRELAESRGEPAPARSLATAAALAATTTKTTTTETSKWTKTATANKAAAPTSRAAPTWQLPGRDPNRRPRVAQGQQATAAPQSSPSAPPQSPCVWTGTSTGQRSLEHRNGCLCRSGHLPVHPFASSQPYWAGEDIKIAKGNINLWGVQGVEEGFAPPHPPAGWPWLRDLRLGDTIRCAMVPAGCNAGGGGRWPC